jgi:hypothetical protein
VTRYFHAYNTHHKRMGHRQAINSHYLLLVLLLISGATTNSQIGHTQLSVRDSVSIYLDSLFVEGTGRQIAVRDNLLTMDPNVVVTDLIGRLMSDSSLYENPYATDAFRILQKLGGIRYDSGLTVLSRGLEYHRLREYAVQALSEAPPAIRSPAVNAMLSWLAEALSVPDEIGSPQSQQDYRIILTFDKRFVIRQFGKMGPLARDAVPALTVVLHDAARDMSLRIEAGEALFHILSVTEFFDVIGPPDSLNTSIDAPFDGWDLIHRAIYMSHGGLFSFLDSCSAQDQEALLSFYSRYFHHQMSGMSDERVRSSFLVMANQMFNIERLQPEHAQPFLDWWEQKLEELVDSAPTQGLRKVAEDSLRALRNRLR